MNGMVRKIGVLAGLCIGAAVIWELRGGASAPTPQPAENKEIPQAARPEADAIRQPDDGAAARKIADLEQQLKNERAVAKQAIAKLSELDAAAHTKIDPAAPPGADKPLAFDSTRPKALLPANFDSAVGKAIKSCKVAATLVSSDCSEFPCIAWFKVSGSAFDLTSCDDWADSFGPMHSIVRSLKSSDGQTVLALLPLGSDAAERKVASYRARERVNAYVAAHPGL